MALDFKALNRELMLPDHRRSWTGRLLHIHPDLIAQKVKRSDIAQIIGYATELIVEKQPTASSNWLALAMLANQEKTFALIKEKGIFRLSKNKFEYQTLNFAILIFSTLAGEIGLANQNKEYLNSVRNLHYFGKNLYRVVNSIRSGAQKRQGQYLKSVVACADAKFMLPREAVEAGTRSKAHHFSVEELIEGASFLIHLFLQDREVKSQDFMMLDEEGIVSKFYDREILKGAKLRRFMEAEIMLDSFGYSCTRSQKMVLIKSSDAIFEKSIRLGYIMNDQARANANILARAAQEDGHESIIEVADKVFDKHRDLFVHLEKSPVTRVTLRIPEQATFEHIIHAPGFYLEELAELSEAKDAEMLTWDEIDTVEVEEGLKAIDLIRVFRFFRFASRILSRELTNLVGDQPELVFRSLLPVFTHDQIIKIFAKCLPDTSEDAIVRSIEILSCDPSKGVIDLQYSPIFRSGDHLLIPLNLLSNMNWWRNLSSRLGRRAIKFADEEAGPRALFQLLSAKSDFSRKQYETEISGVTFELDAIARLGEYTFIFECKHPLLPCNAFELRTSLKHVKTGEKQLDKIMSILKKNENELELYRRLGWSCGPAEKIIPCIVTFNGMFSGLRLGENPVRRWHELRNFIETGTIRVVEPPLEPSEFDPSNPCLTELNLWVSGAKNVSGEDLVNYIYRDIIAKPQFSSMHETIHRTEFDDFTLGYLTYGLNVMALHGQHVAFANQLRLEQVASSVRA